MAFFNVSIYRVISLQFTRMANPEAIDNTAIDQKFLFGLFSNSNRIEVAENGKNGEEENP